MDFRAVVSALPGMAYRGSAGPNRTLDYAGDGCGALTGFPSETLVDGTVSFWRLIHPDDRGRAHREVLDRVRRGRPYRVEFRITTADGRERWVRDCGRGVPDDRGDVASLEGFLLDVTDFRLAGDRVRQRRRLEFLITTISTVFINLASEEVDDAVIGVLESLGDFTGADRLFVARCEGRRDRFGLTHEWCAGGVPSVREKYRDRSTQDFPEVCNRILAGETVRALRSVDAAPDGGTSRSFASGPVRILVPMTSGGGVVGALGLDLGHLVPSRDEDTVTLLRIVGEMVAAALERRESEIALRERDERLRLAATLFESTPEAVMVAGPNARITAVNPAFSAITGYSEQEVLGRNPKMLQSGRHSAEFYRAFWERLTTEGRWNGEIWNRRKNGEVYPQWVSVSAVREPGGSARQWIAVFRDITDEVQAQQYIRHQTYHDGLTGLPNRELLLDRLRQAMKEARHKRSRVAVVQLDLDRFRTVNDTLGRKSGDRLLRETAARIRQAAGPRATVARPESDQFTLMVPDLDRVAAVEQLSRTVSESLSRPFRIGSREAHLTASAGIALFPDDATGAEALLRNAETALEAAKKAGCEQARFYTGRMNDESRHRAILETRLRAAAERGELYLEYQPIVEVDSGRLCGAEALVRWRSPDLGDVSPGRFIPVAEDAGLIVSIGAWVLRTACRQAWFDRGHSCPVSVNLSARECQDPRLVDRVRSILSETGLPSRQLIVEVTETALMAEADEAARVLESLRGLGVGVALDDFGTGYSSLTRLSRLPVDTLKIDRTFVREVGSAKDDAVLVETIIAMAGALRLQVVAEGVETREQLEFLRARRCPRAQGYLFSVPLSPPRFESYLIERSGATSRDAP